MPQLDRSLIKDRAARLRATGQMLHQRHLDKMVGTRQWLLVENNGLAHTENFTLVATPGLRPREIVEATISGHNGKHLDMQLTAAAAA
jgi:threonylcarbamoyladenosine tRNA methylthiotransferase MtaB